MNALRFYFLFSIISVFSLFGADKLQLHFECKDFVDNGNIHQSHYAEGKIFIPSQDDHQFLPRYFHGAIKNENGVLSFRLISQESWCHTSMSVENIDLIDRTKPGFNAVYNDWKLSLQPTNASADPNGVRNFLMEEYKTEKPLLCVQISVKGFPKSKIQFYLDISKIPEVIASPQKSSVQPISNLPSQLNSVPEKPVIEKNNNPYACLVWGCVIVLPLLCGLIYYLKK